MNQNTINVVCLKWGDKYPAEDVNRLYRMVSKNLQLPFKFYCITENTAGLVPEVEALPIYQPELAGWWHKLSIYRKDFYGLTGTVLFLDLDVVITDSLDELFDYQPGRVCSVRDYGKCKWGIINSSVVRFEVGQLDYVWQGFLANQQWIVDHMHGDQDWLGRVAPFIELYPPDWVVSYKKHCQARGHKLLGIGDWLMRKGWLSPIGESKVPDNAKIVLFHGKPDPIDVVNTPYKIWKIAPWIKQYWD